MNDIDIAAKAPSVSPVPPRVARYSSESGKHKPAKAKRRLGRFLPDFAESDRRYENKQEKARGCLAFPSQNTSDGNADRIRLCRDFEGCRENRPFGVARISASLI